MVHRAGFLTMTVLLCKITYVDGPFQAAVCYNYCVTSGFVFGINSIETSDKACYVMGGPCRVPLLYDPEICKCKRVCDNGLSVHHSEEMPRHVDLRFTIHRRISSHPVQILCSERHSIHSHLTCFFSDVMEDSL